MDAVALIRRLHQHRSWVNRKLLAACGALSDDILRQPFQIGQGSIWKSLLHMYGAEYAWLEALLGNADPLVPGDLPGKLPGNQEGKGGAASFSDLEEKWVELSSRWDAYLADLTPQMLGGNGSEEEHQLWTWENPQHVSSRRSPTRLHPRPVHHRSGH